MKLIKRYITLIIIAPVVIISIIIAHAQTASNPAILSINVNVPANVQMVSGTYPPQSATMPQPWANEPYVIVSGSQVATGSVAMTFTGTATSFTGSVGSWYFKNWYVNETDANSPTNSNPSYSPGNTAGWAENVTFNPSAVGETNRVFLDIIHEDPNGLICKTFGHNPWTRVWVNILGEQLAFNFSSWTQPTTGFTGSGTQVQVQTSGTNQPLRWSDDPDTGPTWNAVTPDPPDIGGAVTQYDGSNYWRVWPYEIDLTINTPYSMVNPQDMAVAESSTTTLTRYYSNGTSQTVSWPGSGTYDLSGSCYANAAGGPSPNNPILYAFDDPGPQYEDALSKFNKVWSYNGVNNLTLTSELMTISVTSTAMWHGVVAGNTVTHTFSYTITPIGEPINASWVNIEASD